MVDAAVPKNALPPCGGGMHSGRPLHPSGVPPLRLVVQAAARTHSHAPAFIVIPLRFTAPRPYPHPVHAHTRAGAQAPKGAPGGGAGAAVQRGGVHEDAGHGAGIGPMGPGIGGRPRLAWRVVRLAAPDGASCRRCAWAASRADRGLAGLLGELAGSSGRQCLVLYCTGAGSARMPPAVADGCLVWHAGRPQQTALVLSVITHTSTWACDTELPSHVASKLSIRYSSAVEVVVTHCSLHIAR